jgi:hypothetical protein
MLSVTLSRTQKQKSRKYDELRIQSQREQQSDTIREQQESQSDTIQEQQELSSVSDRMGYDQRKTYG